MCINTKGEEVCVYKLPQHVIDIQLATDETISPEPQDTFRAVL